MKNLQKRKKYISPHIESQFVELESGITAASVTISPGGRNSNTPWNPEIEDWEIEDQTSGGISL